MLERQFSRTAIGVAGYRAAHQKLDGGAVFKDPYAHAILGDDADAVIAAQSVPERKPFRLFMAARSRFAEDRLALAVERGVRQAVVLGAGLDTFALRNPHANLGLRTFEVDHSATQALKLRRLKEAGLAVAPGAAFVSVDFERENFTPKLAAAGFLADQPAFFIWLGVVPYLERATIEATLAEIARVPLAEVVFDYSEPLENHAPEQRAMIAAVSARVAELGEPWISHFDPAEISKILSAQGMAEQEDMGIREIAIRYFGADPQTTPPQAGPHVIHARQSRGG